MKTPVTMSQTYKHPLTAGGSDPHDVWSSFLGRCVEGYVRKALGDALYDARSRVTKQRSLSDLMRSITFDEQKEVKLLLSKSPHDISFVVSLFLQTWINRLFKMNILKMPLPQVVVPNTSAVWRLLRNKIDEHLTHCLGHITDLNVVLSESEISSVIGRFLDAVRDTSKWWGPQKHAEDVHDLLSGSSQDSAVKEEFEDELDEESDDESDKESEAAESDEQSDDESEAAESDGEAISSEPELDE